MFIATGANYIVSEQSFEGQKGTSLKGTPWYLEAGYHGLRWMYIRAGEGKVLVGGERCDSVRCGTSEPFVLEPGEAAYIRCTSMGSPSSFATWEVVPTDETEPTYLKLLSLLQNDFPILREVVEWLKESGKKMEPFYVSGNGSLYAKIEGEYVRFSNHPPNPNNVSRIPCGTNWQRVNGGNLWEIAPNVGC